MDRDSGLAAIEREPALGLLAVAVPIAIAEIAGMADDERIKLAGECGQHLAEHGDDLMFRSKRGRSADAFTNLARGLACAAYQPGGVTFAGQHWCTDHELCQAAARSAAQGEGGQDSCHGTVPGTDAGPTGATVSRTAGSPPASGEE